MITPSEDQIAFWQNGRAVYYREVTTQDLIVDSTRYNCPRARAELARRGVDWAAYA